MFYVYEEKRSGARFQTDQPTHHSPNGEDVREIETRELADEGMPLFECYDSEAPGHKTKTLERGDAKAANKAAAEAKAKADAKTAAPAKPAPAK